MTFVASANPILYQGARPVFIDAESATWNMSPAALAHAMRAARVEADALAAVV
ncbi:DegT/DnrJ/EryC1/StrS family aminotransferase [Natribacillus halophilus]|uniref:DegT/DnrJ/EryC1/StrS family aminotransferase n=1 Tax=Natribacillus halophilus TaxID=549003 RepID=UPI000B87240A